MDTIVWGCAPSQFRRKDGQIFSAGFRSGERDGSGTVARFFGSLSLSVPCHPARSMRTTAEVHGAWQPVDMMDKAHALPTSPQAQQQQQDGMNRILAA